MNNVVNKKYCMVGRDDKQTSPKEPPRMEKDNNSVQPPSMIVL